MTAFIATQILFLVVFFRTPLTELIVIYMTKLHDIKFTDIDALVEQTIEKIVKILMTILLVLFFSVTLLIDIYQNNKSKFF